MNNDDRLPKLVPALICEKIGDEALIYNPAKAEAVSLNATASAVFDCCKEGLTTDAAATRLGSEQDAEASMALLELTLSELASKGLIEALPLPRTTRRNFLVKASTLAAALPLLAMVAAPTAAEASSVCVTPTCTNSVTQCGVICGEDAAECGQRSNICAPEYVRRDSRGTTCLTDVGPQNFTCRLFSDIASRYNTNCTAARALAPDGGRYYCCVC